MTWRDASATMCLLLLCLALTLVGTGEQKRVTLILSPCAFPRTARMFSAPLTHTKGVSLRPPVALPGIRVLHKMLPHNGTGPGDSGSLPCLVFSGFPNPPPRVSSHQLPARSCSFHSCHCFLQVLPDVWLVNDTSCTPHSGLGVPENFPLLKLCPLTHRQLLDQ